MTKQVKHIYQSFLVRCWLLPPTTADEPVPWRFELHEVSAESQKYRFSDYEQLTTFVAARLTAVATHSRQGNDKEDDPKGSKP